VLTGACLQRGFKGFEADDLAIITDSLARLGHPPGEAFLSGLVKACLGLRFMRFSASGLHRFADPTGWQAWAWATTRGNGRAMAALDKELTRRGFGGFPPRRLAGVARAMAVLGHKPSDAALIKLISACKAMARRRGGGFTLEDIAGVVGALGRFKALDRPDADELCGALAASAAPLLARAGTGSGVSELGLAVEAALAGQTRAGPGLYALWEVTKGATPIPPMGKRQAKAQR
jgi:hypothetical protein